MSTNEKMPIDGAFSGLADEDDVEGHVFVKAVDEDDVEGHVFVKALDEDDVEGHAYKFRGPTSRGE